MGWVLVTTAVIVVAALVRNGGTWTYVIDDPAIHLSIADTLAHHGTWGVQAGVYESVSSAPLWTVVLAVGDLLLPLGETWLPLALNLAGAAWVLSVLARAQTLFRPGLRRWLDLLAVGALAVVILFLPGLAAVGMEHTLHVALALEAVYQLHRVRFVEGAAWRSPRIVFALLAVAALVRFETPFVAAGLALGILADGWLAARAGDPPAWRNRVVTAVGCGAAAGLPIAAYGVVNAVMGQDFLPNSVVAKTVLGGGTVSRGLGFASGIEALAKDPLVLVSVVLAAGVVASAWSGVDRRAVLPATTVLVASVLHSFVAEYGWYERYQAYLVALGAYLALTVAASAVTPSTRQAVLVVVVLAALVLAPVKWQLLLKTPIASENTYRQRFQAARFLSEHYDGRPIATGELGYITLLHDGPVVDVLGLGSHEVLDARRDNRDGPDFWRNLARRERVEVVAVYPGSLLFDTPDEWILVGELRLGQESVSVIDERFQFWAPGIEFVEPLRRNLDDFARDDLPADVVYEPNAFVDIRVEQLGG